MLRCTLCGWAIQEVDYESGPLGCVRCGAQLEVEFFPAITQSRQAGSPVEGLLDESDAACFKHGDKKAVGACSECGRFLCGLCEVEMGNDVVCFECFSKAARAGAGGALESRTVLYDSIALALAIVPMILIWPTLITAPLVIFLCFRYWNRTKSLVPRSKGRFIAAGLLAGAQMVGWLFLLVGIVANWEAL